MEKTLESPMDCKEIQPVLPTRSKSALNIQKMKVIVPGPITSQQIDGKTVEIVKSFVLLGSQITAAGDYSHEIKRRLLLGRKAMTNLDSILKILQFSSVAQ